MKNDNTLRSFQIYTETGDGGPRVWFVGCFNGYRFSSSPADGLLLTEKEADNWCKILTNAHFDVRVERPEADERLAAYEKRLEIAKENGEAAECLLCALKTQLCGACLHNRDRVHELHQLATQLRAEVNARGAQIADLQSKLDSRDAEIGLRAGIGKASAFSRETASQALRWVRNPDNIDCSPPKDMVDVLRALTNDGLLSVNPMAGWSLTESGRSFLRKEGGDYRIRVANSWLREYRGRGPQLVFSLSPNITDAAVFDVLDNAVDIQRDLWLHQGLTPDVVRSLPDDAGHESVLTRALDKAGCVYFLGDSIFLNGSSQRVVVRGFSRSKDSKMLGGAETVFGAGFEVPARSVFKSADDGIDRRKDARDVEE